VKAELGEILKHFWNTEQIISLLHWALTYGLRQPNGCN
jgi:hypothetical protein